MSLIPRVTILLRTQENPLLLSRACTDILSQTDPRWHLVIVNDGGDRLRAEKVLESFRVDFSERLTLSHLPKPLGLSAAYNAAIVASESEYLVIYEEGSSWHPDFLWEMTRFLDEPAHARYGGVVCDTQIGDDVFRPVQDQYCFPTISFLFKRSAAVSSGLFDPRLRALSDWEFNFRFISRFEIVRMPKTLARTRLKNAAWQPEAPSPCSLGSSWI